MESLESRQLLSITLPTISDVTSLPAGTSVFVPLAGTDPGETLSYAVTVSDYSKLTPVMMPDTNATIRFTVNVNGVDQTMDFRLFDNFVPIATSTFEDFVQSGTYDTSATNTPIIYRNLKDASDNPLCIQGGNPYLTDPTTIDEEFNPNLQYTSGGILAMARENAPGTSSTEFFITEQSYRAWDYNYAIFGIQIAGSSVVSTIAGMDNESPTSEYLNDPVTITSASIIVDSQTGVLELTAPEGVTGVVTVTVTAYDGTNTPVPRSFTVTIGADSGNPANPWESVTPSAPTSVTFLPPTGTSTVVTNLDNSDINNTLDFQVTGVTSGNLVQILADGNVIGEEYASGSTVIVTTDGWTTLTTGIHQFTAIQIAKDQTVDVIESGDADPISKTADVPSLNSLAVQLTVDLTTPVADLTVAGITTSGGTTQTFTVEYTDDVAVDVSTLDNLDLLVTGPNGYSQLATYMGVTPAGNGALNTATYQIFAPGGTWDSTDNGTYMVSMEAGQVRNTTGNSVESGSLGTFVVSAPSTTPQATATAANITTGATTTYTFTVKYTDDMAIDASTFDDSDVRVTSPNGYDELATFVSATPAGNGTPITATYRINAPGATWDEADNQTYTISIETGQVTDTSGNPVTAGTLRTFLVNVPPATPQASLATVAAITTGGGTTKTFTVTYTDDVAVTVSTLDSSDLLVTGPNGLSQPATYKSVSVNSDGTPRTATYEIPAPGGTWDKADNGTYHVWMVTGQVSDGNGNFVAASELGTFLVNIQPTMTMTINPSSVLESGTATGTITLSEAAPAGGTTVYLSSNDTTEATVPSTVTVPEGKTSVTFDVTGVLDGIVDDAKSATITATAVGYTSGTASVSVQDVDVAMKITLSISPLGIFEGGTTTGHITLSLPAPTGGLTVYLSSNDTTELTVPSTVTIPAGSTTSADFTVTGMLDGAVDGTQNPTITATAIGATQGTTTVSVFDVDVAKTVTVTINPSSIMEGGTATGKITLSQPAQDTSDANYKVTVQALTDNTQQTVTVAGAKTGYKFTFTFGNATTAEIASDATAATLQAALEALSTIGSGNVTVTGNVGGPYTITLTNAAATAPVPLFTSNTLRYIPLTIYLSSSDTTEATVPSMVTIPAGSTTSADFTVTGVLDGVVDTTQSATITATAIGYTSGTASVSVQNVDVAKTVTITINPSSILEGGTATGTITLSQSAPTGGLIVSLSSSDSTEATIPATVFIAAGQTTGTFTITGKPDNIIDGVQSVTITATASDYVTGTVTMRVFDATQTVTVTVDKSIISETGSATGTTTLSQAAQDTTDANYAVTVQAVTSDNIKQSLTIAGAKTGYKFTLKFGNATTSEIASDATAATLQAALEALSTIGSGNVIVTGNEGGPYTITLKNAAATAPVPLFTSSTLRYIPLTIYLSSSDTGEATVPASVTIAAGQTTATFAITGKQDNTIDGSQSVTITATPASLDYATGTASFSVTDATNTISVSIDKTSILETGTATALGLVTLSQAAPEGGLVITLSSSDIGEATVPATIFIGEGATFATFQVTGLKDGVIDGSQSVTITATASDYISGTASLSVRDATKTVDFTIDKTSISETGTATGTITIAENAPAGGLVIHLASSDTSQATVPASVTIAAGTKTVTFMITGVQDSTIDGAQSVTITVTPVSLDYAASTASLTVVDASNTISLTIDTTSILEGGTATGTITLSHVAPAGGLYVSLSSSDTGEATVPETVFIAAGDTTNTFPITGVKDGTLDGLQTVTITATASDYISTTANLGVNDATQALTVTIDTSSITETGTTTGRITLLQAAPTGGLLVTLSSSSTTDATVPAAVTIAAGQKTATFTITGVQDTTLDGTKSVTITATPASVDYASGTASLSVLDATKTISVTIDKSTILETGTATGTITLSQPAPTDGLVVYLSSSNTGEATIPSTVTIAAGQTSGTFTITGVQDGTVDGTQSVTITATAPDYASGTASLSVFDVTKAITVAINKQSIFENGTATGTVTISEAAPAGGLTVTLRSSDTTVAYVPTTVTIPAGSTFTTFTISGVDNPLYTGDKTVTITALAPDYVTGTSSSLSVLDTEEQLTLTLTIDNTVFSETAGASAATGTVTRTGSTDSALVMTLNSSDTTEATVPDTVTIPAGKNYVTFPISAVNDYAVDGTQSVTIAVFAANATTVTAGVSVLDAQALPTLSIGDVSAAEDGGSFTFTIKLSSPTSSAVTVQYATSDGTATAGSDYKAKSGTATIAAGKTSVTLTIPVYGDKDARIERNVQRHAEQRLGRRDDCRRLGRGHDRQRRRDG